MDKNHLLTLNLGKTLGCLRGILSQAEIAKIEAAISENTRQLIRLAEDHLRFAGRANGRSSWRQRVSRGYYSCYVASRAIRLACKLEYSQDVKDHKSIANLPTDFPERTIWEDRLTKFRADRNISDYDHSVTERNLEFSSQTYLEYAAIFLRESKGYLRSKGRL